MWMQQIAPVEQQQYTAQSLPPQQSFQPNMMMNVQPPAFQQQYTQTNPIDARNANTMPPQSATPPSTRSTPQGQQQIQQQQQKQNEEKIDTIYKRQTDGPVLWFAGPPLNINKLEDSKTPVHSMAYLKWKREQAAKNKQ